jgi:hypothetical protein
MKRKKSNNWELIFKVDDNHISAFTVDSRKIQELLQPLFVNCHLRTLSLAHLGHKVVDPYKLQTIFICKGQSIPLRSRLGVALALDRITANVYPARIFLEKEED